MPPLTDLDVVRAALNRDRPWAAYAIGDLAPGFVEDCDWYAPADRSALALVYRGFAPPIVFAMGPGVALAPLFAEIETTAPTISLHLRPEALPALSEGYLVTERRAMRRMVVTPAEFAPVAHSHVRELGEADLPAIRVLYQDGEPRHEQPTFFFASMLGQGTFRGIWDAGGLVAIAGTHLYSRDLGICAIGNVYTRSDRRGHGLAAAVTSAVVAHALDEGVPTIVLNVGRDNTTAARVYQRLGFAFYCDFFEGEARRRHVDSAT